MILWWPTVKGNSMNGRSLKSRLQTRKCHHSWKLFCGIMSRLCIWQHGSVESTYENETILLWNFRQHAMYYHIFEELYTCSILYIMNGHWFEWRQTLFDVKDLVCRAGRFRDRALMPGNGFSLNNSTTVSRDTTQPYITSLVLRNLTRQKCIWRHLILRRPRWHLRRVRCHLTRVRWHQRRLRW